MRFIDLQQITSGSWNPLPGDFVLLASGTIVMGQWPPDGVGMLRETQVLDPKHPCLVVYVQRFVEGHERSHVFHKNRLWWIPRNHWKR